MFYWPALCLPPDKCICKLQRTAFAISVVFLFRLSLLLVIESVSCLCYIGSSIALASFYQYGKLSAEQMAER